MTTFQEAAGPYLSACPGPPLAERGLRLVALQRINGIPGLELPFTSGTQSPCRQPEGCEPYLRSIAQVAAKVHCKPRYLSDAALRRGYSYSRALRWLRFFHGLVLRETETPALGRLRSLGFSDYAGWSRFTLALVGRSPNQLPNMPIEFWVRLAIEDVYLGRRPLGRWSAGGPPIHAKQQVDAWTRHRARDGDSHRFSWKVGPFSFFHEVLAPSVSIKTGAEVVRARFLRCLSGSHTRSV